MSGSAASLGSTSTGSSRICGTRTRRTCVDRVAVVLEDAASATVQGIGVDVSVARRLAVDYGRRKISAAQSRPSRAILSFGRPPPARV